MITRIHQSVSKIEGTSVLYQCLQMPWWLRVVFASYCVGCRFDSTNSRYFWCSVTYRIFHKIILNIRAGLDLYFSSRFVTYFMKHLQWCVVHCVLIVNMLSAHLYLKPLLISFFALHGLLAINLVATQP